MNLGSVLGSWSLLEGWFKALAEKQHNATTVIGKYLRKQVLGLDIDRLPVTPALHLVLPGLKY